MVLFAGYGDCFVCATGGDVDDGVCFYESCFCFIGVVGVAGGQDAEVASAVFFGTWFFTGGYFFTFDLVFDGAFYSRFRVGWGWVVFDGEFVLFVGYFLDSAGGGVSFFGVFYPAVAGALPVGSEAGDGVGVGFVF